ncbi:HEXOKINASE FAMILY MEMBER [Salix purpurea]|uniref:HEXOKINASE FAMILY MEMBER n=1 Tax=Salix purpurea TaxID=77065 RepID=A0A9Q0UQ07_SALPP|nr:HEXOKINASE FAMILY MEMBER [Salix purpurea]
MASIGVSDKSLIVSFGEMLIDFVPTVSGVSLAEAPGFVKAPGGAPANVAIAVTRLGGKGGLIRSAKVFHYGSISLIVEPCRSAHLQAMKVAKDAGALLSYDPNLRLPLWPSEEEAREQIMSIWDEADVVKVSDNELEFLTGSDKIDDETAMLLWRPNFKLLLVTLGEKGCNYYTKNFHGSVEAFHVDTVDTTGAGDSFVGALLCKIVDDQSVLEDEPRLREILRFANACGAITTTKKGAIPALPTTADALELVKEGK